MAGIKLARLPDRQPVKLVIQISPSLHHKLEQYAAIYEAVYRRSETVTDLVPAMLEAFLESDREFVKRWRMGEASAKVRP